MSLEKTTEVVAAALTAQAKDLVNTQGEAWQKFAKQYARDIAEQAWIVKTSQNPAAVAEARENLEWMATDAEAQVSKAGLAIVGDHGPAVLKALLGFAAKLTLGLIAV